MKTDFGVFGGDERNHYLAAELCKKGYRVMGYALSQTRSHSVKLTELSNFQEADTLAELVQESKVLAGPVPFFRYIAEERAAQNGFTKEQDKKAADLTEETLLDNLQAGQMLHAGGLPADFLRRMQEIGAFGIDFFQNDYYQEANAWMTAEGCFAELISAWPGSLKDAKILITGYGYCGRAIAKLFAGAKAAVTVCVRSVSSGWRAYEEGMKVCYYESLGEKLPEQDIIINTVPAKVLGKEELRQAAKEALLVEIASAPGGFSKKDAKEAGISVIDCPGLPGKYSPAGAAKVMAEIMLTAKQP